MIAIDPIPMRTLAALIVDAYQLGRDSEPKPWSEAMAKAQAAATRTALGADDAETSEEAARRVRQERDHWTAEAVRLRAESEGLRAQVDGLRKAAQEQEAAGLAAHRRAEKLRQEVDQLQAKVDEWPEGYVVQKPLAHGFYFRKDRLREREQALTAEADARRQEALRELDAARTNIESQARELAAECAARVAAEAQLAGHGITDDDDAKLVAHDKRKAEELLREVLSESTKSPDRWAVADAISRVAAARSLDLGEGGT